MDKGLLVFLGLESIALLILAMYRKLTRKIFFVIAAFTAIGCIAASVFTGTGMKKNEDKLDQKAYLYMAACLTEKGYPELSLKAMGMVNDSEQTEYGAGILRALDLDMTGAYRSAELTLQDNEDALAVAVFEVAKKKEIAEEPLQKQVVENTISSLGFEDSEKKQIEAQMYIRYLSGKEENTADETDEFYAKVADAIQKNDRITAYAMVKEKAEDGIVRDMILLSQMYLQNYDMHVQDLSDPMYTGFHEQSAAALVELNKTAVVRKDNSTLDSHGDITYTDEDELKYEMALASYRVASEEREAEEAKRVLNYLDENAPDDHEENIAFQFYYAQLCYRCGETQKAKDALDKIFRAEDLPEGWLKEEMGLLTELYIEGAGSGDLAEFENMTGYVLDALCQGFVGNYDHDFIQYIEKYFDELYGGIRVTDIDVTAQPDIVVEVSTSKDDLELTGDNISIIDTGVSIEDFEITKKDIQKISVCFVLDISGSMEGQNMTESKKAIRESVLGMEEDTDVGLVFFDNTASIQCPMTNSKYAVSTAVDKAEASGGTDIAAGLEKGCDVLKNTSGNRVIILLSDGYDGNDDISASTKARLVSEGIRVYTVGLSGCDEDYLGKIAAFSGGSFIGVTNTSQLRKVYEDIQGYMTSVYYISYQIPDGENDRYFYIRENGSYIQTKKFYQLIPAEEERSDEDEESMKQQPQRSDYYRQTGGEAGGAR